MESVKKGPIRLRTLSDEEKRSRKPFPIFKTDKEAEDFVANADLTEYDFSGFKQVTFPELMEIERQRHALKKRQMDLAKAAKERLKRKQKQVALS